ncbi:M23 family metallopeptidase [Pseudonocardia yunnanensis]|uniref:M23 family metallopeptidase n=1 Tax=Pseudonocardia yunnanensis TaxID=58107 RepID=A0ABW4F4D2_9PSEU
MTARRSAALLALGLVLLAACTAPPRVPMQRGHSPITGELRGSEVPPTPAPLIVSTNEPAIPFAASNGKVIATYELSLRNMTPLMLTPIRVEVRSPSGAVLQTLDAAQIPSALALPSARSGVTGLGDGQVGMLFMTLEFATRAEIPDRLENRVTVTAPGFPPVGVTSTSVAVPVSDATVPVLGPPLVPGSGYIAADSCCDSVRNRRAGVSVDNGLWFAHRFAVDWEQLDARGRTVAGDDPDDPADYTIYGKQAIAATDGTVVKVIDGLPDQEPGELPAGIRLDQADGNSVIVAIEDGLYMLYGHLQAGSLHVAEGQQIARGDPIGLVGNSGNSSAPRLHFHVTDGASPVESEGVPYVIDSFTVTGQVTSTQALDGLQNTTQPLPVQPTPSDGAHRDQYPLDRLVVTFP